MAKPYLEFSDVTFLHSEAQTPVLQGLGFALPAGWTGIVGANGAGKTTCLRLATGQLEPTSGKIRGAGGLLCAQRTDDPPEGLEAFLAGENAAAWVWRHRLGIDAAWGTRWDSLSHGERKRIQLAVALWRQPPLLAVDEPTNHVDRDTAATLLEALSAYRGVGLLVSHDRDLLDALCGRCLFLEAGQGTLRPGSWTEGQTQAEREQEHRRRGRQALDQEVRALQVEQQRRREHGDRAERARSKRGLARDDHDGRARADLARLTDGRQGAGIRQLEGRLLQARARLEGAPVSRSFPTGVRLEAQPAPRPVLLRLEEGHLALGPLRVLALPSLVVRPGDRIGISGPNGAGKTTLLAALVRASTLPRGALVQLPQEVGRAQAVEALADLRRLPREALGGVLGLVRRLGSDPARLLQSREPSPGELRKLMLALALAERPCILLLDEPTNHLDLPSVACLEEALQSYPGTLVVVSHDDRLLNRLTRWRWQLQPKDLRVVELQT